MTPQEERWNTATHAIAAAGGLLAASWLTLRCLQQGNSWAVLGMVVYIIGMVGSYAISAFYHAEDPSTARRERLRRADHIAIYWHIACSYAPITLTVLRQEGCWGWGLLLFVMGAALIGTVVSLFHLSRHSHIETLCFCLIGMAVVPALPTLLRLVGRTPIVLLIMQGLCSLTGALFYSLRRKPFAHTVFHIFIATATVFQLAVFYTILK